MNILKDDITSLIKKIALPASVGFIFITLYTVVDSYFAGKHISSEALAGLTFTFPIYLIIMAFGNGLSTGLTALVAESLGQKNSEKAITYIYNGFRLIITISIVLATAVWFGAEPIIKLMGGTGEALQAGVDYLQVTAYEVPLIMISYALNSILTVQGDTKSFRNSVILAFFINCALNPLFILYFNWGAAGLAWATFFVQGIVLFYVYAKVKKSPLSKQFKKEYFVADKVKQVAIIRQGVPSTLNMFTISSQLFFMNYYVVKFAGETAIAGLGAAFRVEHLGLIPTIALNIAVMTIMGQNYGAKQMDRVNETFKKSILLGVVVLGSAAILIFFFGEHLIRFFDDTPEAVSFGKRYLFCSSIILTSFVITNVCTATMQALQKPMIPLYLSLFRRIILFILVMEILTSYFNLGIEGFFYTVLTLPWIGAILFYLFARRTIKKASLSLT